MIISLENFIPLPLTGISREESGFWESGGVVLESPGSYLLTAPSGKGKTSLLSMICGVRKDYRGSILIDGTDIRQYGPMDWSEIRKRKISCIYQGLELFDELTALENIQLKNGILGYKTRDEIREMAQALEMDNFLERETGKLSFGQRQRIAIIRALCQPFGFLLADEIFSHLDKKLEKLTFSLISRECAKNRSGLLLTSLHPLGKFNFDKHFIL